METIDPAAAYPPARPRAVSIVGWGWLVLAALRFANGLLGLLVWKVGGLDQGLPFLPVPIAGLRTPVIGLETILAHTTEIFLVQTLLAGFVGCAAFALLRLRPWGRTAIQIVSILGILVMFGIGVFVYASAAALPVDPSQARAVRIAGASAGAVVALLGAAFFGATLLALRLPAVRAAFERPA